MKKILNDTLRKNIFISIFLWTILVAVFVFVVIYFVTGFNYIKESIIEFFIVASLIIIFTVLGSIFCVNFVFRIIIRVLKNYKSLDREGKLSSDLKEFFMLFKEKSEKENEALTKEINELKQQIKRLEYDRKKEIDPENFNQFMDGIKELTNTEKKIFDLYREGYTVKEILQIANIKESTLRYHNQNIYSKLSVSSMKIMLRYCTLMEISGKSEE